MTCRRLRVLLFQIIESPKIHLVNLFGAWEVGASKVGAPSSHEMSSGLLFIGDASYSFLWLFLAETNSMGMVNIIKILKKNLIKKEIILSGKSCYKDGEIFSKCCLSILGFDFFHMLE